MTLRFIDSFDHYATADLYRKWIPGNIGTSTISAGTGRNGTSSLRMTASSCGVCKGFDSQATWIIGLAYKTPSISAVAQSIIKFRDGSNIHTFLQINPDGTLSLVRQTTSILGPSVLALSTGIWYYIEFKITIADAAPMNSCEVRVNGATWLKNTGGTLDTYNNSGLASANNVLIESTLGSGVSCDFDDVYIEDGVDATATQGAPYNDFLGDHRVIAINPDADGNYHAQFTRNGVAGSDYGNVDEATPNDDTDYLSDTTAGHRTSQTFTDIPAVGTVRAVQHSILARKDDAGVRSIIGFLRRSGADTDEAITHYLGDSYVYYLALMAKHPDGTAWSCAEVNAIEAGIKVVS